MWTWGNSGTAKTQAYLSSIRTWMLVLIIVNNMWDLFVFLHEKLAFKIAQHTSLMSVETTAVGAYVSYYNQAKMFAIADAKYILEKQRSSDVTSFKSYTGACNAFNGDLSHQFNTPTKVVWIVYKPLFTILLYSVVTIFLYAVAKFVVVYWTPFLVPRVFKKELFVMVADAGKYAVSSRDDSGNLATPEGINSSTSISRQTRSDCQVSSSTRSFGTTHLTRFGLAENSITENTVVAPTLPVVPKKSKRRGYARLPLEELINTPIQARSLVRPTFSLDHIVNREKFVSAQLYLEFGVFFAAGRMKPRWGFLNPVPPVIQVNNMVISDMIEPLTPAEQLSKLRPMTAAK